MKEKITSGIVLSGIEPGKIYELGMGTKDKIFLYFLVKYLVEKESKISTILVWLTDVS